MSTNNDYLEIGDSFGVGVLNVCEKVNTTSTDENLFRLVPVPSAHDGHGGQLMCSGTKKRLCSDWCRPPSLGGGFDMITVFNSH